jgi:cysteine desulfurase/selenocysteine lyase
MDPVAVRAQFPALTDAPGVVWLDSATTAQRPRPVLDAMVRASSGGAAGPGRGGHPWAGRAAADVAAVRARAARFLGAPDDPSAVVFTTGATAAMNAVALSWGLANLRDGDEILRCPDDHASTVVPWRNVCDILARFGVGVQLTEYRRAPDGAVRVQAGERVRMVVATHVHPVYGTVTTRADLGELPADCLVCWDCSHSAGHLRFDVASLGADFAVLSGHKMFAAPGVGVLWCAPRTHATLEAFLPGGSGGAAADRMPGLLEGGTPNVPAIVSLGAALDWLDELGIDAVARHTAALTGRAVARLATLPGVELLSAPTAAAGVVSLRMRGIASADVGFALAAHGVYVRAGGHCLAGPDADAVRLSSHAYTSAEEMDRACELLAGIAGGR